MPWEETESEIRHRLRDPEKFQKDSFRRITIQSAKPRVFAIAGKLKGETAMKIQSLRFPKDDGWTVPKAKEWLKDHPDVTKSVSHDARDASEDHAIGDKPMNPIQRMALPVQIRSVDKEARTIRFVASDETVDRYSTIISVAGWDLKAFKLNPVFLVGHDYRSPWAVIGRVIHIEKNAEKSQLLADVLFVEKDINPVAEMIFQMYAHTPPFMNAVSVGFIPFKMEEITDEDESEKKENGTKRKARMKFTSQELLEISAVTVPANPAALVDKAVEMGLDPVVAMAARSVLPDVGDSDEIKALDVRMKGWLCENGVCVPPESGQGDLDGVRLIHINGRPISEMDAAELREELSLMLATNNGELNTGVRAPDMAKMKQMAKMAIEHADECTTVLSDLMDMMDSGKSVDEVNQRAGAVLNARNKSDLVNAQGLIQRVLDSAEKSKPSGEEGKAAPEDSVQGVLLESATPEYIETLTQQLAAIHEELETFGRDILAAIDVLADEARILHSKSDPDDDEDEDDEDNAAGGTGDGDNDAGDDADQSGTKKLNEILARIPGAKPVETKSLVKTEDKKIAEAVNGANAMIALGREILSQLKPASR